jgi:DNA-binding GntR family transcriptional regulator
MIDSTRLTYLRVRRAILDGDLAPGDSVSQVRLAATLAVSRTPLREALRLLENEGLVEAEYNRRVRVRPVSAADLETLTALRLLAEPLGVRLSVPLLSAADLNAAATALDDLNRGADSPGPGPVADPVAVADAHRRFHFALVAKVDDRLRRHIEDLWDHAQRYRVLYTADGRDLGRVTRAARDHQLILEAARAGDAAVCSRRDAEHLARTAFSVVTEIDVRHDPRTLRETLRHVLDGLPADPETSRRAGDRRPSDRKSVSSSPEGKAIR